MNNDNPSNLLNAFGGVFRWGSGILGRTAIVGCVLMGCGGIALWRLHSQWAIVTVVFLLIVSFFVWFFPLLRFCDRHPAETLLEGVHWAQHQQFLAVKGQQPIALGSVRDSALGITEEGEQQISAEEPI